MVIGNIPGANQPLRANYGNFNLSHQINIHGERRKEVGGGDLQKCDYPIKVRVQNVKILNLPMPFRY